MMPRRLPAERLLEAPAINPNFLPRYANTPISTITVASARMKFANTLSNIRARLDQMEAI
jgi:hypothetical protein